MIVAFYSHASCAGKDSCADFAAAWCRGRGIACVRDAFAWDGKVVAADALGIQGTREEKVAAVDRIKNDGYVLWRSGLVVEHKLDDGSMFPTREGDAVSGRDFLIGLLGDPERRTGIRGLDEKFWTHQVLNRDVNRPYDSVTLVSDLRFLEEAESVCETDDGVVVEVVRPDAPRFNEQRLPDRLISHVVNNDGGLDELRAQVEYVMERVCTAAGQTR
jgi:hypothetical protein